MWGCVAFAVGCVILSLIASHFGWGGNLPGHYRNRACQGRSWRQAFPDASKSEIRGFLALFTEAFAFRETERLRLNPDDCVLEVYRELYPPTWNPIRPDAGELEKLAMLLDEQYGLDLERIWRHDLSLGTVFALSRRGSPA